MESDMEKNGTMRERLRHVIFDYDTLPSKAFDLILILCITLSVLTVMLDSVPSLHASAGGFFLALEWFFTVLFSVEYALRLYASPERRRYALSFFGVVDFLSVFPTWLSLFVPGAQYLLVIRFFRVLRIFRLLKLMQFVREANFVKQSVVASSRKILVFLFFVVVLTSIVGALMYLIEGESHGFRSIPESIYWAIVTVTTVGYGDISPETPLGRALAALLMITGYSVLAVPTGIVSAEMAAIDRASRRTKSCASCPELLHDGDARFCRRCGRPLLECVGEDGA